jgi:hypothetical protein
MRQLFWVSVGLLVLAGCGPSRSKPGVVSGKLNYKGQPVGNAALLLYPVGGDLTNPITIPVASDGEFRIADTPNGEYKVVVQGTEGASEADVRGMPPDQAAKAKEKLDAMKTAATIPFPNKYKNLRTTDLKCTITEKDQTMNLELTD